MKFSYRRNFSCFIKSLFLIVMLPIAGVQAHPHSWVSVLTEIEGNETQLTGLRMFWTFDLMTTSDALAGEDVSEQNLPTTLKNLAQDMLINIKESDYFTHMSQQGLPLLFSEPQQGVLTLEDYKLTLSFFLPLRQPLSLPVSNLSLKIYEDTYYVDFLWLQKNDIQLSERFRGDCKIEIVEPQTTAEQIAYAASLARDATGDSNLGRQFTQTVTIDCL